MDGHEETPPASGSAERLAAIKRAVPISRMLDYGLAGEDAARLAALEPGDESWDALAERLGEARLAEAEQWDREGHVSMAGVAREQAAAAFNIAQLSLNVDTPRKAKLYARASATLAAYAECAAVDFKRLELRAADGATLFGWEFPVNEAKGAIVVVGGLSGWGSSFFALARSLTRRGFAVLLAEGPGQGESRLISGLSLRVETLPLFDAFIDRAQAYSERVGLFGNSFGGLIAAQLVARRPDIAACCINCAPLRVRTPQFPAEREQIGAAFGADGETLASLIEAFNLDPARQRIECPLLVLEGGADPVVPSGSQFAVLQAMAASPPQTRQWPDGLHTLYNHAAERNALVSAWFADQFAIFGGKGPDLAGI